MMKKTGEMVSLAMILAMTTWVQADSFGTGDNQFIIEFVTISGATNPRTGYGYVEGDYRIGQCEISNGQWNKFLAEYGLVTGRPSTAYERAPSQAYSTNRPTNNVSWYEAAQFVNWLNISTGHQAAYKFTGTQGQNDYTFTVWDVTDVGYDASNSFRNSNAFYFLPTENEWVKAAYWNGTKLQTYATFDDSKPVAGVDTNYDYAIGGTWQVNRGSEEINGTFNMMGNVMEWTESPYLTGNYAPDSIRSTRGGTFVSSIIITGGIISSYRHDTDPMIEGNALGFRIASIPEPASLILLSLGSLALWRKIHR